MIVFLFNIYLLILFLLVYFKFVPLNLFWKISPLLVLLLLLVGLFIPIASRLPAGSTGQAAIFTDHVKATHVIRRVMLRMIAIVNYVNPF
jgi:hypothetical protein